MTLQMKAPCGSIEMGRTILVCEDDPMVSMLFQEVFKAAGYQVAGACDGESAVKLASELRPAVMTLDIDLPGLDGGAVIERLKGNPSTAEIPVIIISAHPGWLTFLDRHQAAAVLEKPCSPWELQAAVEQVLQQHNPECQQRGAGLQGQGDDRRDRVLAVRGLSDRGGA